MDTMKNKSPLAVVILAAGKGTRMHSKHPKVMHTIAGRPIISWLIETAESLNPEKIIVVIAPDMDDVADAVSPHPTVIQEKQLGTGDAVKPALPLLKEFDGKVLILLGDEPFLNEKTLQKMIASDGLSVMAVEPSSAQGLGRVMLDNDGMLERIVEDKDCTAAELKITLCNAGNFCVPGKYLESWITQLENKNKQKEYYLTDLPHIAKKDNIATHVIKTISPSVWGVNTRSELAAHEKIAQTTLRQRAMEGGATLIDPETVTFSWDTHIGQDVLIEPHVIFGTDVTIDDDAKIFGFSSIEGAYIKAGALIGPFARIRPQSTIGRGAKVGTFVEVNRTTIKRGAKAPHLSYLGDVTIGQNTNVGAGTVFANYDGFFKHKSMVGENVFIGSNSTIIAPVVIGKGSILAAGSNINKDIPDNAMAIGRSRQENHLGWASEYRNVKAQEKGKE